MNEEKLQQALEELRGYIQRDVAAGFRSIVDIPTFATEVLADEYDAEELRPHAERLTHELLQAHLQQQATWPPTTDCDRLDAAFAELEKLGIVARQDFSCCSNCGQSEIWDEMEAVGRAGIRVRGYTFYHMQNTEAAVEGGGIYLGYGSVDEGEAAALSIAREIIKILQHHGLITQWDGTWATKILIELDWKRRR